MPAYVTKDMANNMITKNLETGELGSRKDIDKYILSLIYAPYCVSEYYPNVKMTVEENEQIAIVKTPIINAIKEKEIAWIMGKSDIETEWADFMTQLDSMGLGTMMNIYQNALDRVK